MDDYYHDYWDMIDAMDRLETQVPLPVDFGSCEYFCCPSHQHDYEDDTADAIEGED